MWEDQGITYDKVKEDAVHIQDACNPIAVANYLVRASKVVDNHHGKGFDALRQDPYIKAIIGKLCSLYGIDHDWKIYDVLYPDK
jgi:hypothetical protein